MVSKTKIAVGAGALALALTACGGSSTPESTKTVTVYETVAPQPAPATDSYGLVDAVRAQDSYFDSLDASMITETAQSICDGFDAGMTLSQLSEVAATTIGVDHAVVLTAGAIIYLCPEYSYLAN